MPNNILKTPLEEEIKGVLKLINIGWFNPTVEKDRRDLRGLLELLKGTFSRQAIEAVYINFLVPKL